jgi:hypothetical protein
LHAETTLRTFVDRVFSAFVVDSTKISIGTQFLVENLISIVEDSTAQGLESMQGSFNWWNNTAAFPKPVGQYSQQLLLRSATDFTKSKTLATVLWQKGFQGGHAFCKQPNTGNDICFGQFIWFAGVFMARALPPHVLPFDRPYEIDDKINWHSVEMIDAEYALI